MGNSVFLRGIETKKDREAKVSNVLLKHHTYVT